jgi:TRAP-type C4-dicarboxylate transport system permease small subunit
MKLKVIVVSVLEIVVMAVLAYQGVMLSILTWDNLTSSLQWPVAVFYLPLTLGSIGVIYYSTLRIWKSIREE